MILPLLLLLATTIAASTPRSSLCGSTDLPPSLAATIAQLRTTESSMKLHARNIGTQGSLPIINVPVHFHTVSSEAKKNTISNTSLAKQFAVLRDAYAQYDINMQWDRTLASETVNDELARGGVAVAVEEWARKSEFLGTVRKGGYDELNFYHYTDYPFGLWGMCTFPAVNITMSLNGTEFREDGCDINADALPGGPFEQVNLGFTGVHEAGHWFGLLHTFQSYACNDTGDLVDDTPASSIDSIGCPIGKDSCPDSPGLDPIHNFMDYSDDSCYNDFTEGQKVRMHALWNNARNPANLKRNVTENWIAAEQDRKITWPRRIKQH